MAFVGVWGGFAGIWLGTRAGSVGVAVVVAGAGAEGVGAAVAVTGGVGLGAGAAVTGGVVAAGTGGGAVACVAGTGAGAGVTGTVACWWVWLTGLCRWLADLRLTGLWTWAIAVADVLVEWSTAVDECVELAFGRALLPHPAATAAAPSVISRTRLTGKASMSRTW